MKDEAGSILSVTTKVMSLASPWFSSTSRSQSVGYDSGAQRKREFAAEMGVQSHTLRMAAEGAVAAYEQVVGETWKPFDRSVENPGASLDRKAAEAQMAAFG